MIPRRVVTTMVAVVALSLAATGASARPNGAGDIFRVRPDPRLCPSPLCGGFFVGRLNRATTPCADGTARAWCYVAELNLSRLGAPARARIRTATGTGGVLLRGRLINGGGIPELPSSTGRFVATTGWLAATAATWQTTTYLVSDTGVRCIRAPCFSLRAAVANTVGSRVISGLDLAGVAATPALVRKAQTAVRGPGLLVAGTIRVDTAGSPTSGRTLLADQFFLPAG